MRQSFFQKPEVWSKWLGLLMSVGVIVVGVILPHIVLANSPLYDLAWAIVGGLIGLYYLSIGVKKLRHPQEQPPQVRWYTQPSILVAIGMFFIVFVSLVFLVLGLSRLALTVWMAVLLLRPTGICWLAALVFLVRDRRAPKTM